MEYGIQVFGSTSKTNLRHLEIIQNHAMRIIMSLRMLTPILSIQIEYKLSLLISLLLKLQFLPFSTFSTSVIQSQWERVKQLNWTVLSHKAPFF